MIVLLVQLACWHLIAFALVSPRISYAATTIDLSKEFARSSGSSGDAFIQRLASQEPRIRSTLVLEKGKIVSEYYRSDIDPNENHQVWSATKSWMGMLVGMLVKDGLLNTDETLGDVFSDDIWMNIADSQFRKNVTIEELLTMSSGFFDEWERGYQWTSYENGTAGGANVTDSLQFPLVGERGTFQYLGTSQILSYVLDSRTNLTPFEYLKEKLLPSIGIDATNISWWANVDQMSYGYHGLNLTPEQMAKFGQLYLQEGMVGSTVTPLVDPEWIKLSSSPKINVRSRIFTDFSVDYGYLMWIFNMPNRTDIASFYCAMGIGGQNICVCTELERVSVQQRDWSLDLQRNDTLTEILGGIVAPPVTFLAMNKTLDFSDVTYTTDLDELNSGGCQLKWWHSPSFMLLLGFVIVL